MAIITGMLAAAALATAPTSKAPATARVYPPCTRRGISMRCRRRWTGRDSGSWPTPVVVTVVDYPRETAWFRCVTGCKAIATPPPAP